MSQYSCKSAEFLEKKVALLLLRYFPPDMSGRLKKKQTIPNPISTKGIISKIERSQYSMVTLENISKKQR